MELTVKCKEDFEKWYELNYEAIGLRSIDDEFYLAGFYELPEAMQYSVYVDFFDSEKVDIQTRRSATYLKYYWIVNYDSDGLKYKTRPETRTAAIKKANEIYNLK